MRVLVDTNVLLDVALDREPFAEDAAAVLDAAQAGRLHAWVAWHAVSNFYYLCASRQDDRVARQYLADLMAFTDVIAGDTADVNRALSFRMRDFEDALQSAAALACGADLIVTRNIKDFRQSPVPAVLPRRVLDDM